MNSELHGLTDFWKEPWTASTWSTWSSQGPASQGLQSSLWMYTSYAPKGVENEYDLEPYANLGCTSSASRFPSPVTSPAARQPWPKQRVSAPDYFHQHQHHQNQQHLTHQFRQPRSHSATLSPSMIPLTPPDLSPQRCEPGLALGVSRAPARPRRSFSLDSELSSLSGSSGAASTMFQIGGYRTIELLPTAQQRQTLQKWFGVVRWTHNRAVDALRADPGATATSLRTAVAQAEAEHDWAAAVPLSIRDATVAQLVGALHLAQRSAEVAAAATGESVAMEPIGTAAVNSALKYRTRKDRLEHVVLRAGGFQCGIPYPDHFGYAPLASSAPVPDRLENDAILIRSTERFYLCIMEASSVDRRDSMF